MEEWASPKVRLYNSQYVNLTKLTTFHSTDDKAAIKCQHQQIAAVGIAAFYNSQRGGGAAEAAEYTTAINYVESYLNQGHLSDDWVTYYNLHAI